MILSAKGGKYFKADDVPAGKSKKLTIESVGTEKIGNDQRVVVRFAESEQGLALNQGNKRILVESLGEDTDEWIGKVIGLARGMTEYKDRPTPCVVVRTAKFPGESTTAPAPPTPNELDDLPF